MMLANVRARLGREDAQLVLRLLSRGGPEAARAAERTLADQGIDPLLDDPVLLRELIEARQSAHASLPLFCYVVVRHALRRNGSDNRMLADYVASVLLHFGLRERARRIADSDDQVYDSLARIVEDVESADAERAFLARAHLGNYALWLSGLFPDHIEHRRWRRGGPDLEYYETLGRRGFQLAAGHRLANKHGLAPLYDAAAVSFPTMRRALNAVSDALLFRDVHTPERLMRQVRDAFTSDRVS
jgi:hypothetical protein